MLNLAKPNCFMRVNKNEIYNYIHAEMPKPNNKLIKISETNFCIPTINEHNHIVNLNYTLPRIY
jgi:hypothetical protein